MYNSLLHILSMKRLTSWQDVKQPTVLLVLFNFPNKHEVWNEQGSLNLNNLSSVQQKHSKSQTHVTVIYRINVTRHNEQVKKNRVTVYWCCVSNCSSVTSVPGPWYVVHIIKQRKFHGISNVLKNHAPLLENHLNSATVI